MGFVSGSRIVASGPIAAFKSFDIHASPGVSHVRFQDLTIDNADNAAPAGSVGIDLEAVSLSTIARCSLRYHDRGIHGYDSTGGGGYYNHVVDCELASNQYGVYLEHSANAWEIRGGRLSFQNIAGVYVQDSTGVHISSTFEKVPTAIHFASGARENSVTDSYFENPGPEPDPNKPFAAVRCDAGATYNWVDGSSVVSDDFDRFIDEDGSNVFLHHRPVSFPSVQAHIASGELWFNGGFESDSNGDGLADGLSITPFPAPGQDVGLDPNVTRRRVGTSQRWSVTGVSQRTLDKTFVVTPGHWYVLTGWTFIPAGSEGRFEVIAEDKPGAPLVLASSGVLQRSGLWQFHRHTVLPATTSLFWHATQTPPLGPGTIYLDEWSCKPGVIPSDFEEDGAARHPTAMGNTLTAAATVTVTHTIHRITGVIPISSIIAPANFCGTITLLPDTTITVAQGGNILTSLPLVVYPQYAPITLAWDPSQAKWYAK
jgi:hypothetical protein